MSGVGLSWEQLGCRTNDKGLAWGGGGCVGGTSSVCNIIGAGAEGANCAEPLETLPRAVFSYLLQSMTHL